MTWTMDILSSVVRFTDDAAALEKTLRLFQSLATIHVGLTASATALELRRELALGRRYFRLFKWYPCFVAAYASSKAERVSVEASLEAIKFTFLGLYFLLEATTITNTLRVTDFSWGLWAQEEANKCWFYALLASLALSANCLCYATAPFESRSTQHSSRSTSQSVDSRVKVSGTSTASRTTARPSLSRSTTKAKLYTQLVIDGCDLLLPGSAVGWISVGWVTVGIASTVSTVLAGRQIWKRIQSGAGS